MSQSFDPPQPPVETAEHSPRDGSERSSHPVLALAAYSDDLIAGARVAVFGEATLPLPFELLDRGARLVHVYDLDPARIAEATATGHTRSLYFGSLHDEGDIGVRDGAFDVVFVPDLSFTRRPDDLLALVRRVLAVSGAAIVAMPNVDTPQGAKAAGPGRLGYYELYDAISRHFPRVRMVGQVPFVGYAMAEFAAGADDLEPTIDSSLVAREREPGWFVALASARPVLLESYVLVETPPADEPRTTGDGADVAQADVSTTAGNGAEPVADAREQLVGTLTRERDDARAALQQERRAREQDRVAATRHEHRAATLERDLSGLRERLAGVGAELETEIKRRSAAEAENGRLRRSPEVAHQRDRIVELENRLGSAAADREHEVASLRERCASLEAQLGVAAGRRERDLASLRERASSLEAELASVHAERDRSVAAARDRVAALETELASRASDYEKGLAASQARSAALQAELTSATAEHERSVTAFHEQMASWEADLASARAEHRRSVDAARQQSAALEAKLASVDAEHERTLTSLRERIASLETQLSAVAADQENEVARLERLLKERGRLVADLRAEVARRDHLVREMVAMGVPPNEGGTNSGSAPQGSTPPPGASSGNGSSGPFETAVTAMGGPAQHLSVSFSGFGELAADVRPDVLERPGDSKTTGTANLDESSPSELRDRLDTLAREASRREADLVAATWKIAQLERQLAQVQR